MSTLEDKADIAVTIGGGTAKGREGSSPGHGDNILEFQPLYETGHVHGTSAAVSE